MHLQCFLYDPDIPHENIRADYHHVCCSQSHAGNMQDLLNSMLPLTESGIGEYG